MGHTATSLKKTYEDYVIWRAANPEGSISFPAGLVLQDDGTIGTLEELAEKHRNGEVPKI